MKVHGRERNAFMEWSDIVHAFFGFISGLTIKFKPLLSIIFIVIFIVYQALEAETPEQSYQDLVEFITGFIVSIPLVCR